MAIEGHSRLTPDGNATVKDITATVVEAAMTKGSMGLTQSFSAIGNASAMVVLVAIFIASLFYISVLHTQGMTTFQQLHQEGLALTKQMMDTQQKQIDTQESRHVEERRQANDIIKANSVAIERLAEEVRLSRIDRQTNPSKKKNDE